CDDEESIRLPPVRSYFCQELIWRDTGRCGETQLVLDLLTNGDRHTRRGRQTCLVLTYIEISLIQRHRFNQICILREDFTRRPRGCHVTRKIWRYKDRVGAQAFRATYRHCRAHSKAPCFI